MATTFGKYVIEKKLGQGGMGAVYLAVDAALNRKVALKVITSADAEMIERFHQEAQSVAKLKHPNIVQVYEAGTINKKHYFTMDYIEGIPLDKLIHAKPKPSIQTLAKIIEQVAAALYYAHCHNVIHRDIKPANILIDKQGKAFIADFGLAKQMSGLDKKLTVTGTTVGTPDYMSPEQAMGKKKEIDHRSDIFSLGATLYHCLTGQVPFTGKEIYEVFSKVINEDPPSPSSIMKIIPKDLETICLKCLNKESSKRYQTAEELGQDIKRYLNGEPIAAKRTSSIAKIYLKAKRNRTTSLAILGTAVILMIVVISLSVSSANRKKLIADYRQSANQEFKDTRDGHFDRARTFCTKLLALAPKDEEILSLLKECEDIIAEQDKKWKADQKAAQEVAAKAKESLKVRNKAKAIMDRATGTPSPDQKIKIANEALEKDPTFGDAYQFIGYAYKEKAARELQQGGSKFREYIDKACENFSLAIETTKTLAYSYYERALITVYTYNKPEDSIPDFEKTLEYDPNSHIGWYAKGSVQYIQKKYDDAIKSFTEAISRFQDFEYAYNTRGVVYCDKNELGLALADFRAAVTKNKTFFMAYNNCGNVLYKQRQFDEAIAYYSGAIKLNPKYIIAYNNRGLAYSAKGELDKAIADFNDVIKLDKKHAEAYKNRGDVYYKQGQLDNSIANFNEAIRLNPEFALAYGSRGLAHSAKGDMDKALADSNEAIRLAPQIAELYANRGVVYFNRKEFDKSIADYNEALRMDPECAGAYYNRGNAYKKKDDIDNAIADYTEAVRLDPKLALAYYNRGIMCYKKKDLDNAMADFNRTIKLEAKYADAYWNRAVCYSDKGEYRLAVSDGEMFLKLAPDSPSAKEMRALIEAWKKQVK
ncbi:MAG: tetratricopeptide repeat protein [Planctomycetota bacterium]